MQQKETKTMQHYTYNKRACMQQAHVIFINESTSKSIPIKPSQREIEAKTRRYRQNLNIVW
jgi:hypothetical protein